MGETLHIRPTVHKLFCLLALAFSGPILRSMIRWPLRYAISQGQSTLLLLLMGRMHINQSLESALSGEPILTDNRSLQMGPSVGQYI